MTGEDVRHEIVQFRREEIADLSAMPSASGQHEMLHSSRPTYRLARAVGFLALAIVGLVVAAWMAVFLVGSSSAVSNLLRSRVEAAVRQTLGDSADVVMGPARLRLDGARALAVELDDFGLKQGENAPRLDAGQLSVGVRLLPLLVGRLELSDARISNARLDLGKGGDKPAWLTAISGEDGLIDADLIGPAAFSMVQRLSDLARRSGGGSIALENVTVVTGARELIFRDLRLDGEGSESSLAGEVGVDAVGYALTGAATSTGGRVETFTLAADDANADGVSATRAAISGERNASVDNSVVRVSLDKLGYEMDFGPRGKLKSDTKLVVRAKEGEGKFEIERLDLRAGESEFRFTGAVGKLPDKAGPPSYRFELVSNESLIAPEESTESTMPAAIRLAGTYQPEARQLDVRDIRVRASSGETTGTARFVMETGKSPAMRLDLNVHDMAVAQVKQLWPWMAAGGARRWVMNNFFGGTVVDGEVTYDIAVGRLQDRTPLSATEVSGRFAVRGSRFDTAGLLPAVRDAVGAVKFAGERVEISLESGDAFVGQGKQVSLSNGTMVIVDVKVRPLIARLEMDFEGDASTVAEVASREPLNALRGIDITAADLKGLVKGRVSADIPLQKGVDRKTLAWKVALDYQGVDIAKPIQGQRIEDASGTMQLQRDKAVIKAKGKMNGIPAEFDLVQPIGGSAVPVERNIVLVMSDKERAAIAPGLNAIMSGPVKLSLDASSKSARKISADLTQTKLMAPWIGWSKGVGIAAKATFDLMPDGQVKNLALDGKTFSARGSIDMKGGSFRSAHFDTLALNPGDKVALTVERNGDNYEITASGASVDGRALIKQLYEQGGTAASKANVTVNADVQAIAGFNDETLHNAKVQYRSNPSGGGAASVSGIFGRNAPFSMDDERKGGNRRVSVSTGDAGSLLRFLNVYTRMGGGNLQLALAGAESLRGQVEVRNFEVVNEPRLDSVVGSSSSGQSLDQATRSKIDTKRVQFSRAFAQLNKGPGSLSVANAVLRGPVIGTTFEGVVYDADRQMDLRGTFLPAYGLNSIFGDIPILGAFLGGGQNGGLIGVTYRLRGNVRSPVVEVNPLSAIAPGIFRKIFEY